MDERGNMLKYIVIIVVALIAGINARSARIINGTDDTIENRPYMVSLEYDGKHKCGGSIISKRYILTAGHCIHWDYKLSLLVVRSGTSFKEEGGSVSRIKDYYRPLDFMGYNHSDIALIRLKEPFDFGPTRQKIELFDVNEKYEPRVDAVVSGWGKTNKTDWNNQLQSVVVPIVTDENCDVAYGKLNPGQFCAGYYGKGEKDSCGGDSGGPLVIDGPVPRQVGVVSFGLKCARPYHPGVYTEVAHFKQWIGRYVAL